GLVNSNLPADVRGRVLLGELGCTGCHEAREADTREADTLEAGAVIERRVGPDLTTAGSRLQPSYLRAFLLHPHAMEPGTTMPDMLRNLNGDELQRAATELSQFLRSFASNAPTPTAIDRNQADQGRELYASIGCQSCHAVTADSRHRQSQKYTLDSLTAFLLAPH